MIGLRIKSPMSKSWLVLCLFFFSIHSICGKNISTKKRVCLIGAGPYGLFSLKQLAENLDVLEPVVYEKNSDVGGTWIYTENGVIDEHGLPVHSGVYKNLRTSTAKETMGCPDFDFKGGNHSSVSHETVLEYLRNYTDHFNLRQFIKVNTLVEKVVPVADNNDWRKTKWLVQIRNLNTNETEETNCDFVMVCSGHTHSPSIPNTPGIESFPGRVIHSHSYRRPEQFVNQTVLLLGAGSSGLDLAFEISEYAQTVYLSHRHEKISSVPENVIQVAGVISVNGHELHLQDGSTIQADSFIFCTGYKNDLPFLQVSSGIEVYKNYLHPLYKQIVNVEHPSMSFIGFPDKLAFFCHKPYVQVKYYVALIRGEVVLPSRIEMLKDADLLIPGSVDIEKPNWQWDYMTALAKDGHFELPFDDLYKRKKNIWECHRSNNNHYYKDYDLRVLNDDTVILVKSDIK